jgi:hypothetical protein
MAQASSSYRPRAPERDVLRGVVCEHFETFAIARGRTATATLSRASLSASFGSM